MSRQGGEASLEPVLSSSHPFVDLLLGIESRLGGLDALLDGRADGPSAVVDDDDELVDVLLGLLSVRETFGLILRAITEEETSEATPPPDDAATWGREVLR